jgi:hypothetical protein
VFEDRMLRRIYGFKREEGAGWLLKTAQRGVS